MLKTQRERKFLILSFLISFLTLGTFFLGLLSAYFLVAGFMAEMATGEIFLFTHL